MKSLFQDTAFIIGFWSSIIIFLILNFMLCSMTNQFSNITTDFGVPFLAYRTNISSNYSTYVFWSGLIADVVIAFLSSFGIGLGFKSACSEISSRRLN